MTRAKISEYSATAGDNTDVNGVDIAEGCPPSSMNNMGREIMAALKRFQVGSDGDPVTIGGQLAVTGTTTTSPAIVAAGDTNTGIFFPAADTIAFAEGGAEAMRIDSSGNVGIGTTTPATKLNVYDASSSQLLVQGDSTTNIISARYSSDATAPAIIGRKFRGSVASPSAVNSSDVAGNLIFQAYGGTNNRNIALIQGAVETYTSDTNISGALLFSTNGGSTATTERMRITSDGYLRMASGSGGIQFNGDTAAANALDDYEEGTWTGTIKGSTTDPTTPVTATGRYTKIGRQIFADIGFANVNTTGAAGNFSISGLPFTSAQTIATGNAMVFTMLTYAGGQNLSPFISGGGSTIFVYYSVSNAGWANATHNAGTGRYIYISLTYNV